MPNKTTEVFSTGDVIQVSNLAMCGATMRPQGRELFGGGSVSTLSLDTACLKLYIIGDYFENLIKFSLPHPILQ